MQGCTWCQLPQHRAILDLAFPGTNLPFPSLQEAACAYVLMVTAVYWVSEAVPLGAAALVPAFLYPLFGVLRSSEVRPLVTQPSAWAWLCQAEGASQSPGGGGFSPTEHHASAVPAPQFFLFSPGSFFPWNGLRTCLCQEACHD